FLLFSPWSFRLEYFLVDPVIFGILAGVWVSHSPALLRLLIGRRARHLKVETAARSTFVEKHVHRTSRRTGILLYVSLLEREAVLVADVGLDAVVATPAWQQAAAALDAAVRRGEDGVAVAARVRDLAPVVAPLCAHVEGQVNELEDEVAE